MKNIILSLLAALLLICPSPARGETLEAVDYLNSMNWAKLFENYLGDLYNSHGCLHFTPSNIYLLTKTIAPGTSLTIKGYGETKLPPAYQNAPFFNAVTNSMQQVESLKEIFKNFKARLVVYPALGRLFVVINDAPYLQMKLQAGMPENYLMVVDLKKGKPIKWDFTLSTPTDAGNYAILRATSHYVSPTYYANTVVPFGGLISRPGGYWSFRENSKWFSLPQHIAADLSRPLGDQDYNYYDIKLDDAGKIISARWAGNEFGKNALLWTKDGLTQYPELGYSEGELLFEQITLIEDLSQILTVPGADELDALLENNENFSTYRDIYYFVNSGGETVSGRIDPVAVSYYRLYNGLKLSRLDFNNLDKRVIEAFEVYKSGNFPFLPKERDRIRGLYYYLRDFDQQMKKQAGWYELLKDNWPVFSYLRYKLREDFDNLGIYSDVNRQIVLNDWLSDRLEFKQILPSGVRRRPRLSFTSFFKPEAEISPFSAREQEALREIIRQAATGEVEGLKIESVDALNEYNFGVLLNDMLGNLYKSHGCLHVSPRNIYLLYRLLPIGAPLVVESYTAKADEKQFKDLPYLADLVNFEDDLEILGENFASPRLVSARVFPASRLWIIYLKDQPFAKMQIEPGPQDRVKIMEGRDKNGLPLFEKITAYPTTPGTFYIFKKVVNYVSNTYYDTTIIPQGAWLKNDKGRWLFDNGSGRWIAAPKDIQKDLALPSEARSFSYYDQVRDEAGDLLRARWGSNTFGKYPIITSVNMRTPSPELAHTSGDLIMEQRRLVADLIAVLSAPRDRFEDCIKYSRNFDLYTACWEFIKDPKRDDLLELNESGNYKLYLGMPLTSEEAASLPPDVFVAQKVINNRGELTASEIDLLLKEKLAVRRGKSLNIDMDKIYGIMYDVYQYVVAIRKNANIYGTLKTRWEGLTNLRRALLADFKKFIIKDPEVFLDYTQELVLDRVELKRLTQSEAYRLLEKLLETKR
ncbi:hypothetical protein HZC35_05180 [Candidatus Saganbacteria bacterium]|nr:hypothetical protein [Candidatus Saganbacteria bacterium]